MLTLITDHFRNIKKNICCTKLFVKNIPKILSFIRLDDHLSNSLFKFNSACNNKTPTEVIFMHILGAENSTKTLTLRKKNIIEVVHRAARIVNIAIGRRTIRRSIFINLQKRC
jgi:hypothetical protein